MKLGSLMALLVLSGCQTHDPYSLEGMHARAAYRARGECLAYYTLREDKLIYPDPMAICEWVYKAVRSGRTPRGWML